MSIHAKTAALFAGAVLLLAAPAGAQSWSEPPYDPPVGSHWVLQSTTVSAETSASGELSETSIGMRSELTFEEKTAEGYRVSFVNRDVTLTGDARKLAMMRPLLNALKGIVVRGRLDSGGAPLAVDNLAEVRGHFKDGIDRMADATADKPQMARILRQLLSGMLLVDGKDAAVTYFDGLPQLAAGQNTGLKPGEVRKTVEQVKIPIGNTLMKSDVTLRIAKFDTAKGAVVLVRERALDPEAVRAFALALVKQIGAVTDKPIPHELADIMKQVTIAVNERGELDVEGGMTRAVHVQSMVTASAFGQAYHKQETRTVTLTRVP